MDARQQDPDTQLKQARQRLSVLEAERAALQQLITRLERGSSGAGRSELASADEALRTPTIVRSHMDETAKIRLFRSIFRGREDVYALRFESKRTGRSGYSPTCRNERVRGICRKPQIRCGDCDRRELLPLTDDVIRAHLIGYDRQRVSAGRMWHSVRRVSRVSW